MSNEDAIEFFKKMVRGWMGNLMRDLSEQGVDVPLELLAEALQELSDELNEDIRGYKELPEHEEPT